MITREEIKQKIHEYGSSMIDFGMDLIDRPKDIPYKEIADYIEELEAKLAEYENRSCEGCEYWKEAKLTDWYRTPNEMMCSKFGIRPSKDFCCNNYEPKD